MRGTTITQNASTACDSLLLTFAPLKSFRFSDFLFVDIIHSFPVITSSYDLQQYRGNLIFDFIYTHMLVRIYYEEHSLEAASKEHSRREFVKNISEEHSWEEVTKNIPQSIAARRIRFIGTKYRFFFPFFSCILLVCCKL